ncbi:MAG: hypothetical protein JWN63_307, partial [Candidatus Acidoferrum typicum]|nr:hypothetical protein [Candidatus Acidoferrum typicum]
MKSREASTRSALKTLVKEDGFAIIPACLDEGTVEMLSVEF